MGKDKGGDDGSGLVGEKMEIGSRKKGRGFSTQNQHNNI